MAKVVIRKKKTAAKVALPARKATVVSPESRRDVMFRVTLWEPKKENGPLELAHNPADVSAANEHEAWLEFMRINGISGSDNDRTIEKV